MMLCGMFVMEEDDTLVIFGGVPEKWLEEDRPVKMGPVQTAFGPVSVEAQKREGEISVDWEARWHDRAPKLVFRPAGREEISIDAPEAKGSLTLR
jgi:hypothetical protein